MNRKLSNMRVKFLPAVFLALLAVSASAQTLVPPVDPAQTITYWKPHVIDPGLDPQVARAHGVFQVLLRAWDRARLAPSLYVVDADTGLWAASLADGSILVTRFALETLQEFGRERGEHLLAFVLAHELAHQRADDLWHQRFFRLIGDQDPELQRQLTLGFDLNAGMLADMAEKEAQADHDGLLLMASVGYDPYEILDGRDFFTAWIENIWQAPCALGETANRADGRRASLAEACQVARSRALRTRAQLNAVAAQATLYTMGVQAFVAGRYATARRYFSAYGHTYTNRAVLYAIGMTHFAEALACQARLRRYGALTVPAFYYPLLLDATPLAPEAPSADTAGKRASHEAAIKQERHNRAHHLAHAVHLFEKAIRLAPDHPKTYLMLAASYLLDGNTFMAEGILQGKYIPRFETDGAAELILAMAAAVAGDVAKARPMFRQLAEGLPAAAAGPGGFSRDLLTYATIYNAAALAEHQGQAVPSGGHWEALARQAKASGNGLLFRLALNQLAVGAPEVEGIPEAPKVAGLRIGDRFARVSPGSGPALRSDAFWIEGEPYTVWRHPDGGRFIVGPQERVVCAWRDAGQTPLAARISIGDDAGRPMKALGIPDRRLSLLAGEYWAYDDYGVAVHIENRKVAGWFLYDSD